MLLFALLVIIILFWGSLRWDIRITINFVTIKTLKNFFWIVSGGWAGGNASKDLAKNAEMMWKQSVWSSSISATISSRFLKAGGVLTLTGADAALKGTPGMIGYGLAKAAVHHLTKSLADSKSGLPDDSLVISILPITLDTPMNRKWMPNADFSTWTPLDFIAEYDTFRRKFDF